MGRMLAKAFPLLSIVSQLFWMGFFMLGSLPLLVLKHDTPKDASFIRNLFNVYYVVLMVLASLGASVCGYLGENRVALAMAGLVVFVFALRLCVIPYMDRLRIDMQDGDRAAVGRFRGTHIGGMVLNAAQLAAVAWGMTRLISA